MATVPNSTVADWYAQYPGMMGPAASVSVGATPSAPTGMIAANAPAKIDPSTQVDAGGLKYPTEKAVGTNWNVDPSQTVQGQVNQIVAKDSPLMQQAATTAKQQMNGRGLLNSSMAIGAGQSAVIGAALPIASQDAKTYADSGRYNADVGNSMSTFNTTATNTAAADQARLKLSAETSNAGNATQQVVQQASAQTSKDLADIEAKYRTGLQTSASMASLYQGLVDNINRITLSPDLDGPAKQVAIDNMQTMYGNALATQQVISGLNLPSLLKFEGAPTVFAPAAAAAAPAPAVDPNSRATWQQGMNQYEGSGAA